MRLADDYSFKSPVTTIDSLICCQRQGPRPIQPDISADIRRIRLGIKDLHQTLLHIHFYISTDPVQYDTLVIIILFAYVNLLIAISIKQIIN